MDDKYSFIGNPFAYQFPASLIYTLHKSNLNHSFPPHAHCQLHCVFIYRTIWDVRHAVEVAHILFMECSSSNVHIRGNLSWTAVLLVLAACMLWHITVQTRYASVFIINPTKDFLLLLADKWQPREWHGSTTFQDKPTTFMSSYRNGQISYNSFIRRRMYEIICRSSVPFPGPPFTCEFQRGLGNNFELIRSEFLCCSNCWSNARIIIIINSRPLPPGKGHDRWTTIIFLFTLRHIPLISNSSRNDQLNCGIFT